MLSYKCPDCDAMLTRLAKVTLAFRKHAARFHMEGGDGHTGTVFTGCGHAECVAIADAILDQKERKWRLTT